VRGWYPERIATASPPARRVRLSSDERRASIVRAAAEVFLEVGLTGARTKAIAERAGITEAVLYRHFDSKEQIFEVAVLEPLERQLNTLVEGSRAIVDGGGDRRGRIQRMEELWLRSLQGILPMAGVALFCDLESGGRAYRQVVSPFLDGMQDVVDDLGGERTDDPTIVIHAAFGMNMMLVLDAQYRGKAVDAKRLARQVANVFSEGLSRPSVP
jgi:AcrR family transcriptional regulator